jgi:thiol-disulfide isomerase/thioredoxin
MKNSNRLPVAAMLTLALFSYQTVSIAQTSVRPGQYRAVLKTVGGDLPFGLDIQPGTSAGSYAVLVLNGTERLPMDAATLTGDSLRIPMALFESELVARVAGETLTGFWKRRPTSGPARTLPFVARFGPAYRFVPDNFAPAVARPTAAKPGLGLDKPNTYEPGARPLGPRPVGPLPGDVTGKYAAVFRSEDGRDSSMKVGVFQQRGNRVSGTFLTPTGDYRFLDGNMVGDSLLLSTFDGSNLYLVKARQLPDGRLVGMFRSGVSSVRTFTARPDPNATLPDARSATFLKPGKTTLDFSFPQPDGTVVSSKDERFRGKVTIVQLLGTWCPNCMDETAFLSPWSKKNRPRGVEVIGLAFETSTDLAVAGPKIERMKKRFALDYPVVLAGSNAPAESGKALPALNRVAAFPTTIFIDKKGQVREIHSGFNGPGTGRYYDEFVDGFNRLVSKLLAE